MFNVSGILFHFHIMYVELVITFWVYRISHRWSVFLIDPRAWWNMPVHKACCFLFHLQKTFKWLPKSFEVNPALSLWFAFFHRFALPAFNQHPTEAYCCAEDVCFLSFAVTLTVVFFSVPILYFWGFTSYLNWGRSLLRKWSKTWTIIVIQETCNIVPNM